MCLRRIKETSVYYWWMTWRARCLTSGYVKFQMLWHFCCAIWKWVKGLKGAVQSVISSKQLMPNRREIAVKRTEAIDALSRTSYFPILMPSPLKCYPCSWLVNAQLRNKASLWLHIFWRGIVSVAISARARPQPSCLRSHRGCVCSHIPK